MHQKIPCFQATLQHLWQMLRKCQATAETTKKVPGATRHSHETMHSHHWLSNHPAMA